MLARVEQTAISPIAPALIWSPATRAGRGRWRACDACCGKRAGAAANGSFCWRMTGETVARWATDTAPTSAECLRLYGARKAREGRRAPTGGTNMATGMMIQWEPAMGGLMEMGEAHWAGPPSAVRTDRLLPRAMECASAKELSRTLSLWTARLVDNAVWHLCEETTPGFIP